MLGWSFVRIEHSNAALKKALVFRETKRSLWTIAVAAIPMSVVSFSLSANSSAHALTWSTLDGFKVTSQKSEALPNGFSLVSIGDCDGMGELLLQNTEGKPTLWQGSRSGFTAAKVPDALGTAATLSVVQLI